MFIRNGINNGGIYVVALMRIMSLTCELLGRGVISGVFVVQRYALLTVENQQLSAIDVVIAADDVEAVALAWGKARRRYCELWHGERLVAFIDDSFASHCVENESEVIRGKSAAAAERTGCSFTPAWPRSSYIRS